METQQNKEDREICVKVNSFDFEMPYCKLKRWFDQEGGWIFRGENLKSYKETGDSTERHTTDKGDLILDLAKEFTVSIDEALRDAYYSDSRSLPIGNENMTESEKNQRIIWAIKYTALINKVRNQFKARVTDDNDEFCERHKEDSIVQGNIHNALLPKGVFPVPLYGYDCIGIGAKKRWLVIPYTTYSFMDNLAGVRINSVRLVRPRNTRKRTLCGTEMAVEWVFHAFQPMIAHPKTSVYGRWTHASELPEGLLHAAFCVPRMRVSVCSVVKNPNRSSH